MYYSASPRQREVDGGIKAHSLLVTGFIRTLESSGTQSVCLPVFCQMHDSDQPQPTLRMMPSPESAFSQVPTELWDQIPANPEMDNDSLLNLAFVSMNVYHRCLFTLLARFGLKREALEQRIELSLGGTLQERNHFYILSLPYLVDRTWEFVCYFPVGNSTTQSLPGFQYRVNRAQAVLSRLTPVKQVRLRFTFRRSALEPSLQV
jgi:hypothetical protein